MVRARGARNSVGRTLAAESFSAGSEKNIPQMTGWQSCQTSRLSNSTGLTSGGTAPSVGKPRFPATGGAQTPRQLEHQ